MQWPDEIANALIQIHLSHRPSSVPAFIPFITFIPSENLWNWDGGEGGKNETHAARLLVLALARALALEYLAPGTAPRSVP